MVRNARAFFTALALCLAPLAVAVSPRPACAQTHDPRQQYRTYETAHFRVHYYQGLLPIARRVAALGEAVYARVGDLVGHHPEQVTEVVLADRTDFANGSAIAIPYNTIRLWVTAPEDLSTLGDTDDWLRTLSTHEFTHIAHTDNISGIPAVINAVLGKVYPPNSVQPPFVLEGIAVYAESAYTTAGRLRSSVWDMYLRADALRPQGMASLDQVANQVNRWPHGDLYYLYGSHFIQYIVGRFGEDAIARMATDYGANPIPIAINRSLQRATGRTFENLYPEFVRDTVRRYQEQRDAIVRAGVVEGVQLTHQGEEVAYPRFLHDSRTVVYESSDGRSHAQLRTLDAYPSALDPRPRDGDWVQYLSGFAFTPDERAVLVSDMGVHRGIYTYHDLFERPVERRGDGGLRIEEGPALTDGARTRYPDVSPDGDHVAFVVNHHGTQALYEMSRAEGSPRQLFRTRTYEQVYTPRYSPDGSRIVFSQWSEGGYRDIRVYDRATGTIRDLTHDRAVDLEPVFTPDGRHVIFSSDRTGVHNLYSYDLATGEQRRLTNVVYGAFMPAVSPDVRWLVYVGYHARGFDLYRLGLDIEGSPVLDLRTERLDGGTLGTSRENARVPAVTEPEGRDHPYNTLQTLYPRSWTANIEDDGFGPRISVGTQGRDVVGNHAWSATANVGLVNPQPGFLFAYSYEGLRPSLRVELYRSVGRGAWRVGRSTPGYPEARFGGSAQVSVGIPQRFQSHGITLRYDAQYVDQPEGVPFSAFVDPSYPPPTPPYQGFVGTARLTYSFSRQQRYTYDVSTHEGYGFVTSIRATDPVLGGNQRGAEFSFAGELFIPMPWDIDRRAHVLAVRAAGGVAVNDTTRANFYLGGFPAINAGDLLNVLANLGTGSGVALRGYPEATRRGDAYGMVNAEYRFPIVQIDRGILTLPVFLRRLYGGVFTDIGAAFFASRGLRREQIAVGAGAELLADLMLGYYWNFTVRGGVARGFFGDDATFQGYLSLSSPF